MWSKSTTLESSRERRMRWREFGGHSKRFMSKGEEEIAARTLRVSNYFYYPKSPFLVQSGLLGSCKKLFPSRSSPRDISKALLCCGAKVCHIQVSSVHLRSDQQPNLLHPHTDRWLGPSNCFPPEAFKPRFSWICRSAYVCSSALVSLGAGSQTASTCLLPLCSSCSHCGFCLSVYLFAQLFSFFAADIGSTIQTQQLWSPTAGRCVMRARPFNVRTSCSYQWILNGTHLLSGWQRHIYRAQKINDLHYCALLTSTSVCGSFLKKNLLGGCRDFSWKAPPPPSLSF